MNRDTNPRRKTMIEGLQRHLLVAATALAACMAFAAPVSAQQTADSIWSGGPIITMNDKAMRAEAVAVAGGKILAVGKRSEVMKLKGPADPTRGSEGPDPRARLCRCARAHRHRRPAGALCQRAGSARRQGAGHRLAAADAARLDAEERRRGREDQTTHRIRLRQRAAQGTAPPHQGRAGRRLAGHSRPHRPPISRTWPPPIPPC